MNFSPNINDSQLSWVDLLKEQVSSLRYGVVQIVVHDRRVVQIDRTEKFRLETSEKQGRPEQ